ncbi:hypothetical protein [Actinomadura litoris]|uniref:hypothetical protein n=1 Tax=Actinomadura litoris TaxID=2678616 RepID=UPI001FA6B5C1|nr:hypothetical protein [Actinomadura litoris]
MRSALSAAAITGAAALSLSLVPAAANAANAAPSPTTSRARSLSAATTEAGSWRPYGNTNPITSSSSTWRCASTETIAASVLAQVCAIRSPGGGSVQGAVIVRNNRSNLYSTTASMDLFTTSGIGLGDWACSSSGVGAHSWSVCFGRTLTQSSPVNSEGFAGGTYLGISSAV